MALSQKKLALKRSKHNQSRKNKKYNPNKTHYVVREGKAIAQATPEAQHNPVTDTIIL